MSQGSNCDGPMLYRRTICSVRTALSLLSNYFRTHCLELNTGRKNGRKQGKGKGEGWGRGREGEGGEVGKEREGEGGRGIYYHPRDHVAQCEFY